jgi:hypothetical protein
MTVEKTITSIFMIPTLKIPKDKLKENGFINGYVKDGGRDIQYENSVYVLFKPENLDKFREFLDKEYERTKTVIEDYDYEDGYVVVVYQLNDKYKKDFNLIKQGKYSKTSKSFQNEFPKLVKIVREGDVKEAMSLQTRVFMRTDDLIEYWEERLGMNLKITLGEDYELWDIFDETKETLEIDKIKELCATEKC